MEKDLSTAFILVFYNFFIYSIIFISRYRYRGDVIQYSNLKMIEGLSFGEFLKHLLRAFSLSTSLFSGVGDELCETYNTICNTCRYRDDIWRNCYGTWNRYTY